MNNFNKRINLNVPLKDLSLIVCSQYNLGEFINDKLIKIGYEDYNYILTTSKGKFVVKVFSNERTDEDCVHLAERASVPIDYGLSCPKIYKVDNNALSIISLKDNKYRLIVMDYIDGKDFFTLQQLPNEHEIKLIAQELAKLNQIQYNPPFIYDKWAIVNFAKEYENYKDILDKENQSELEKVYQMFLNVDFSKLKYGYVHGDIIETNVIKSNNGEKLYFIDFSVANYLPRIVDIAVTICDLCLDLDDVNVSKQRIKEFLSSYGSISSLSKYEKECLKVFLLTHQANTILQTTKEKKILNNDSQENESFLRKSKLGLKLMLSNNSFSEIKCSKTI